MLLSLIRGMLSPHSIETNSSTEMTYWMLWKTLIHRKMCKENKNIQSVHIARKVYIYITNIILETNIKYEQFSIEIMKWKSFMSKVHALTIFINTNSSCVTWDIPSNWLFRVYFLMFSPMNRSEIENSNYMLFSWCNKCGYLVLFVQYLISKLHKLEVNK